MNTSNEKKRLIILHSKPWSSDVFAFANIVFEEGEYDLVCINSKIEFERYESFHETDTLLFIHWNWIVPAKITEEFHCICFHMTDLPFGRGGSPLQNLLIRGIETTKVSAIKMTQELDAGPVYMKRTLKLTGSAQEIYLRASQLSLIMAKDIIRDATLPVKQEGDVVQFERLTYADNEIEEKKVGLNYFINMVRMLDAATYPAAYILYGDLKINFENVREDDGLIIGNYSVEANKNAN